MTGSTRREYRTPIFDSTRWDGFTPRPDDIIIATPPKCGTTWMQRIVSCLVFGTAELPDQLATVSPWLDWLLGERDLETILADLERQEHRRFIKTHLPADGLPGLPPTVSYIVVGRDLRDVAMSFHNHMRHIPEMAGEVPGDPREFWREFFSGGRIRGSDVPPLEAFTGHLLTWWPRRDSPYQLMVHYQDLLDDLEGQMRRVAAHLGIGVPEEAWPDLVKACRFESMRADSARLAPLAAADGSTRWFFNRGTSGQWRQTMTGQDLELYDRALAVLPAELRQWLEGPRPEG